MVKVRLARAGSNRRPYYRVVAVDSRAKRDGRFLEKLGTYDPTRTPSEIRVDLERVEHWVKCGAELSDTVAHLVRQQRIAAPAV